MKRFGLHIMSASLALSFVACSSEQKLKISEIRGTCKELKPAVSGDPRLGSEKKTVVIEGFLTNGTKNSSGDEANLTVMESLDSGDSVNVTFKVGTQSNQIQFVSPDDFVVKTSDGKAAKPKDKVRITGDLQALYGSCDIEAKSIEKL